MQTIVSVSLFYIQKMKILVILLICNTCYIYIYTRFFILQLISKWQKSYQWYKELPPLFTHRAHSHLHNCLNIPDRKRSNPGAHVPFWCCVCFTPEQFLSSSLNLFQASYFVECPSASVGLQGACWIQVTHFKQEYHGAMVCSSHCIAPRGPWCSLRSIRWRAADLFPSLLMLTWMPWVSWYLQCWFTVKLPLVSL